MKFDRSYKIVPLATWSRAALFRSFRSFDDAVMTCSFEPDILPLYRRAKACGDSFFLMTLFAIAKAMNSVPEMRMRFLNDEAVAEYEVVHPSTPLLTADGENYRQTTLPYFPTFAEFALAAKPIVEAVRRGSADGALRDEDLPNIFCASCVPWFSASGYVPATFVRSQDVHVLTWFKMTAAGTVLVNSTFNHCFSDGLHVGRFFSAVAENFARPETL